MPFNRLNALNQNLDISGTEDHSPDGYLLEESFKLGFPVAGQSGSTLSIILVSGGIVTANGLSGMTDKSITRFITISGADSASNNGTFQIKEFVSATSIKYENSIATAVDINNGSISWIERNPYTLQDDLNYIRTDRAEIKGVNYYEDIPVYQRPDLIGVDVPANLSNISGKTLDAKYQIIDKKIRNIPVSIGDTFVTITDIGNFPHADITNFTGVPLFDNAPYLANYNACYAGIINSSRESTLEVFSDSTKRVFGVTRAGTALSPDSVEIEFRMVNKGNDLSTSSIYTWEEGQPSIIDIYYGFSVRSDLLDPAANRLVFINSITTNSADANFSRLILEISGALVYINDGDVVLKT